MKQPTRFRYVTPTRTGRWRESMKDARVAAARAGFGSVDEHSGTAYLDVLVTIESDDGQIIR